MRTSVGVFPQFSVEIFCCAWLLPKYRHSSCWNGEGTWRAVFLQQEFSVPAQSQPGALSEVSRPRGLLCSGQRNLVSQWATYHGWCSRPLEPSGSRDTGPAVHSPHYKFTNWKVVLGVICYSWMLEVERWLRPPLAPTHLCTCTCMNMCTHTRITSTLTA